MNITFNTKDYSYKNPVFGSKAAIKFLKKLKDTPNTKYIKATFDDVVRAYNELGYDVLQKRGSHATVVISNDIRLSLVMPHGGKKSVTPTELKKLKHIANGEIEKAIRLG